MSSATHWPLRLCRLETQQHKAHSKTGIRRKPVRPHPPMMLPHFHPKSRAPNKPFTFHALYHPPPALAWSHTCAPSQSHMCAPSHPCSPLIGMLRGLRRTDMKVVIPPHGGRQADSHGARPIYLLSPLFPVSLLASVN